jgi:hypothetical protein
MKKNLFNKANLKIGQLVKFYYSEPEFPDLNESGIDRIVKINKISFKINGSLKRFGFDGKMIKDHEGDNTINYFCEPIK